MSQGESRQNGQERGLRETQRPADQRAHTTEAPPVWTHARLPLSINQTTTRRWTLYEDAVNLPLLGVEAIGLWRPKLPDSGDGEAVRVLEQVGLKVSSLSWAGGFTGANGYGQREAIEDAKEAIAQAQRLRAGCLVIVTGPRNLHTRKHAMDLVVESLQELVGVADEHGVTLALKPMQPFYAPRWTFLHTLDQTLEVLARVAHPALKIAFSSYHLWTEPKLVERLRELAPLVAVAQLSDWPHPPRNDADQCLVGQGRVPTAEIIDALLSGGYDGYFELEVWSRRLWQGDCFEQVRRCLQHLRALPLPSRHATV